MTEQSVPFLDLVTIHRQLEDEFVHVFRNALRSAQFIGGPEVEGFEAEFAAFCGTRYCVGVANGTDAVRFALMGAGVGKGDAVVTVAHTFIATVEAISQAGAETEFVDIDEGTYTMSPTALAAYLEGCATDAATGLPLGQRTGKPIKAIVPVHLYGQVADMDRLRARCREVPAGDHRGRLPGAWCGVSVRGGSGSVAPGGKPRARRGVQLLSGQEPGGLRRSGRRHDR